MTNALFEKGREGFLDGSIDWDTDTIKAFLVDLNTADTGVKAVTAATNATPIVVTATAHGFTNGDAVTIGGVTGNTNANGKFRIANVAANTFELTNYDTGANIAGNGAFGGTAYVVNLTATKFRADIDAGLIGAAVTLASKTVTDGVADSADVTFSTVSGASVEAVGLYKDNGSAAADRMIAIYDVATGLPVTPNGGDIIVQWDNTARLLMFKL